MKLSFHDAIIEYSKDYADIYDVLEEALQNSTGDVFEIGTGIFSTPFLHYRCKSLGRSLTSFEENESFYNLAKTWEDQTHTVHMVQDYTTLSLNGLVFIDSFPTEQRGDIARNCTGTIIIHDL